MRRRGRGNDASLTQASAACALLSPPTAPAARAVHASNIQPPRQHGAPKTSLMRNRITRITCAITRASSVGGRHGLRWPPKVGNLLVRKRARLGACGGTRRITRMVRFRETISATNYRESNKTTHCVSTMFSPRVETKAEIAGDCTLNGFGDSMGGCSALASRNTRAHTTRRPDPTRQTWEVPEDGLARCLLAESKCLAHMCCAELFPANYLAPEFCFYMLVVKTVKDIKWDGSATYSLLSNL